MKEIENEPEELISSRVRYFRANRLLRQSSSHTIKTLQTIQKDHVNLPNSICNHNIAGIDPMDRESTITAMVIDLTAREMHIAWGNPCQNSYHTYHLDAWEKKRIRVKRLPVRQSLFNGENVLAYNKEGRYWVAKQTFIDSQLIKVSMLTAKSRSFWWTGFLNALVQNFELELLLLFMKSAIDVIKKPRQG